MRSSRGAWSTTVAPLRRADRSSKTPAKIAALEDRVAVLQADNAKLLEEDAQLRTKHRRALGARSANLYRAHEAAH